MQVSLVAAIDRERAIGKDNQLPWHLPADLKRFKALTLGKPVLMGRLTAESMGRALPGRSNLVLTRGATAPFEGMRTVVSLDQALEVAAAQGADELCVIGGGGVFELALPLADRLHLTHVDTVVEDPDAYFPDYDPSQWRAVHSEHRAADARHAFAFEFVDYARS